jgi:hypothetical protein
VRFTDEPPFAELWAFREKVVRRETKAFAAPDPKETAVLVKHLVYSADAAMQKVCREVRAFENFENLPVARREWIPKEVRMFVWQRDEGKCRECGLKQNLEYDHMIPVVEGGATTEGNLQLLCGPCNRRKGRNV